MELDWIPWDSLPPMDDQAVDASSQSELRRSLLPAPLRIGSVSTSPSHHQTPSPPISPTPTLLVLVQDVGHSNSMSGNLSLHEYRRKLSCPNVDGTTTSPSRKLRRKPKTVNLNNQQTDNTPLSPPQTPPPLPASLSSPQLSPDLKSEHQTFCPRPEKIPILPGWSELSPTESTCLPFVCTAPQSTSTDHHLYETLTIRKPHKRSLITLRDSIWRIPTKLTSHTKSASESALPRSLRHRGVSFEILNPRRRADLDMSPLPNEINSHINRLTTTPSTLECLQGTKSPPRRLHRRSLSLGAERRWTPPRALFKDLPTAHSSITSGTLNKNKTLDMLSGVTNEDKRTTSFSHEFVTASPEPAPASAELRGTRDGIPSTYLVESNALCHEKGHIEQALNARRRPNKLVKRHTLAKNGRFTGCPRIKPIILTFLNRHQPNLHGARGRIEKPKAIRDIINGTSSALSTTSDENIEQNIQTVSGTPPPHSGFVYDNIVYNSANEMDETADSLTPEPTGKGDTCTGKVSGNELPVVQPSNLSPEESKRLTEWKSFILTGSTDYVTTEELPKSLQRTSIFGPNFSRPRSSPRSRRRILDRRAGHQHQLSCSDPPIDMLKENPPDSPQALSLSSSEYVHWQKPEIPGPLVCPSRPVSPIEDNNIDSENIYRLEQSSPETVRSSPSNRLSQHTASSMALRTPQRPKSMLPFKSLDRKGYHPFFHAHLGRQRSMEQGQSSASPVGHRKKSSINSVLDGISDSEGDLISEKDWETATESQIFNTRSRNMISNLESGSSLANYSSAGSLASRGFADLPSDPPLHGHSSLSHRPLHRFHKPSWMQASHQRRVPEISAPSYPRHLYSMSELPRDPEILYSSAPPLMASKTHQPAPRAVSYSHYQHPTPLREPHANPFRSTPPSLTEHTGDVNAKEGRGRSSFVSAIRSSKFNFQNDDNNPFNYSFNAGPIRRLHDLPTRASMGTSAWWTETSMNAMRPQHSFNNAPFLSSTRGVGHKSSLHKHSLSNHYQSSTTQDVLSTDIIDSKNSLPVKAHPARISSLTSRAPNATSQDIELDRLTRTGSRSTTGKSRGNSFGNFVSSIPGSRQTPGSLYLSIRSTRDRVRNRRHTRTLTNASTSTTNEQLLPAGADTRAGSRGGSRCSFAMDYETRIERIASPRSCFGVPSPSASSRPPTRSQSAATSRKLRSPRPDDILRERLEQIETASIVLSNHSPSMHESCVRSPWTTCQPAKHFTVSKGASSLFATIDEEAIIAPSDAYCSTYGRHIFTEPPRLVPQQCRGHRQLREQQRQDGEEGYRDASRVEGHGAGSLSTQRRIGRRLIILLSLGAPFGWFVVAYIGFEGKLADSLIRWWSDGAVGEFHVKEKYWASQLAVSFAVFTLIVMLVVLTVCLTAL